MENLIVALGQRRFVTGLDLGQPSSFTALAILERTDRSVNDNDRGPWQSHYDVVHLDRLAIGTPYAAIRDQLAKRFANPPLERSYLAIDHTGVGKAVLDLFRCKPIAARVLPITVTGGASAMRSDQGWLVPKKDLVGGLQVLLQGRRLHLASELAHVETLIQELQTFQIKLTPTANDLVTLWREGCHDDLVLAVAIAACAGEMCLRNPGGQAPYVIEVESDRLSRRRMW